MVAIGGIADIVQHWHEMARSRMTQSGHRPLAQPAHGRPSLEVMTLLASVVAAASESLLIVRQYALDYVEHADYHIRPSLIGKDRAN
jgi:hypothetical protein